MGQLKEEKPFICVSEKGTADVNIYTPDFHQVRLYRWETCGWGMFFFALFFNNKDIVKFLLYLQKSCDIKFTQYGLVSEKTE